MAWQKHLSQRARRYWPTPTIAVGCQFEYSRGAILETTVGSMQGYTKCAAKMEPYLKRH